MPEQEELDSPSSLSERISAEASAVGVELSATQLSLLERYYQLLENWNKTINLTALPLAERSISTIKRLIVEPLIAARYVEDTTLSWLDVGSGGGSPAVPLKIVRPLAALTLVEARIRKAAFLNEVVRSLPLQTTRVVAKRLEELASAQDQPVDVVTSRGVRLNDTTVGAIAALLRRGGSLLFFGAVTAQSADFPGFSKVSETPLPSGRLLVLIKLG